MRRSRGLGTATTFTPSRFLSDANYFLVIFAGLPVAFVQEPPAIADDRYDRDSRWWPL